MDKVRCTAIVLAAGQGKRMGSEIRKQFLEMKGKPILCYSLDCFERTAFIDDIILVTGEESVSFCKRDIVERYGYKKISHVVVGGKERYDSVYEGLKACGGTDYVFIHDGARPFIDTAILERARAGVIEHGACIVGMPAKDTIKIVNSRDCVMNTPNRNTVWTVQTPQVFKWETIYGAHEKIRGSDMSGITDDAMIMEQQGNVVKMVQGSYENIKITTPEDLLIAEAFLNREKSL